jgi:hypothetical protein
MPEQQVSLRDYGNIRAATCAVNGIEQKTKDLVRRFANAYMHLAIAPTRGLLRDCSLRYGA